MKMANDVDIKSVIQAISDAELLGSELMHGFSIAEISQFVALASDLPIIIQDVSVVWPEFMALDDAARSDLVSYVQANCKFPANVTVEAWTQKVLSAIILLSSIFQVVTG